SVLLISVFAGQAENNSNPLIEVTGSATINIVPDRITLEIGMEEYYKQKVFGDSTIVKLSDIEKSVRKTLREAGVPDSLIVVSDLGNYRNRDISATFLMAKRISATVSDFSQIDKISEKLDRKGITSFNIVKIDNSDISRYNRQGLKAALDAAREKAEFIAENENLKIVMPFEIAETSNEPMHYSAFSNVAFDGGSGMENMRRIVRRYSVKVSYLFTNK
ncbi:MAG: SIMPL domain-containing protein, partial [Muribaculaceae bacterium]|nr:SIMPL domain-containing protein [Muribaculaceae bacterium]